MKSPGTISISRQPSTTTFPPRTTALSRIFHEAAPSCYRLTDALSRWICNVERKGIVLEGSGGKRGWNGRGGRWERATCIASFVPRVILLPARAKLGAEIQREGQRERDVNPMWNTPVFAHWLSNFCIRNYLTTGHPFIFHVQKPLTHLSRWELASEMFPPSTFENPFSIFPLEWSEKRSDSVPVKNFSLYCE